MTSSSTQEIRSGERFGFGDNWLQFVELVDQARVEQAEESLAGWLGPDGLRGRRFLDIGCGSGLFSLAAYRLGARVHSFDYDPSSVLATGTLRSNCAEGGRWSLDEGSVLDAPYMESLGRFDIVYSWGVLHHTGSMWQALSNACDAVAEGGQLYIALYNDMGRETRRWRRIKKTYCSLPGPLQAPFAALAVAPSELKELIKSVLRLRPQDYVREWTRYSERRGMSKWRDIVDWVGGYPYEAASTAEVVSFCEERGLRPVDVRPTKGLGCNEFLFRRETG